MLANPSRRALAKCTESSRRVSVDSERQASDTKRAWELVSFWPLQHVPLGAKKSSEIGGPEATSESEEEFCSQARKALGFTRHSVQMFGESLEESASFVIAGVLRFLSQTSSSGCGHLGVRRFHLAQASWEDRAGHQRGLQFPQRKVRQ